MECKKCKKECLESELADGICKDCRTETKSSTIKTIVISVVISVVLTLLIIALLNNSTKLSDFKIDSFNMETEKTTYTYSDDSYSYDGEGTITCKDKNTDYIVLLEQKNISSGETDYSYVVVHNGTGKFGTYDSSFTGTTEKPNYQFNILGFRSFKK